MQFFWEKKRFTTIRMTVFQSEEGRRDVGAEWIKSRRRMEESDRSLAGVLVLRADGVAAVNFFFPSD